MEVFNYELLKILSAHTKVSPKLCHDAWIYQTCLAMNGNVFFDKQAHILYRQHRSNAIGRRTAKKTWFRRFNYLFSAGKNNRLEAVRDFMRISKPHCRTITKDYCSNLFVTRQG
ncbi:MAG: hypothetical protein LBS52_07800 [Dysgonamonadaceae bacterium]|nr:hypothetical protein [Dysgonamonadaceae bacterium]